MGALLMLHRKRVWRTVRASLIFVSGREADRCTAFHRGRERDDQQRIFPQAYAGHPDMAEYSCSGRGKDGESPALPLPENLAALVAPYRAHRI